MYRTVCRRYTSSLKSLFSLNSAGYKSRYAIENIYPDSNPDVLRKTDFKPNDSSGGDEEFSGVIPKGELDIKYLRSSGPGGQNVNKVSTKVQMKFNIDNATWIPEWIKPKLKEQQKHRLNKSGEMILSSEKTRSQALNQADCLDRIRHMIFQASIKPKEMSEETKEKIAKSIAKANYKRLKKKKEYSQIKQNRQLPMS